MKDGDYMSCETTHLYQLEDFNEAIIDSTLKEVCDALKERGYNPINQIVGYIMSGDPGYISSHKEARSKMMRLDRTKIIEIMVRSYIDKIKWNI